MVQKKVGSDAELREAARRPWGSTAAERVFDTPEGPVRLTPTEVKIMGYIERYAGCPCTKAQIATALGRNEKTVGRLLMRLRRIGLVESVPMYADSGAQLANIYRPVKVREK